MNEDDKVIKTIEDGLEEAEKTLNERVDSVKSEVETKVSEVESDLDGLKEKIDEQAKLNGEVSEDLQEQYKNAEKQYTSLKERLDALESKGGRLGAGDNRQSFKDKIHKALSENSERLSSYKDNRTPVSMELKEFSPQGMNQKATMTQGNNLTGTVVEPTRVPGVQYDPERRTRVRQFLPQGTTDSNAIWYIEETSITDNTDVVAEGAAKPENDLDLEQKSSAVTKIAAHFDVSEEMLEDIDYMSSHISLRGTEKYFNKEDQQLLYGTGSSNQLQGLTVSATDYAFDNYTGDSNAQEYDVLLEAAKQVQDQNYTPTAALMSISRYYDMIRRKDSDGNYVMPQQVIFGNQQPMVAGIPIIQTNALNDDDFLLADFPMLTTLFDRTGVNVRFYDQNEDNAIKNLVTVVIEARLALPTYLPNAGRYGDFSTAITNAGNS